MIKVFIGGFPLEASELELVQLVSQYGTVSTIKVVRDKKTKICKGYAFLEMPEREEAELAVEMLNGAAMGSRNLKLSIRDEEYQQPDLPTQYVKVFKPVSGKSKRPRRSL